MKLLRLLLILYALTFAVAPKIFDVVRTQRGYDAVGGEVFIFLIPLAIWIVVDYQKRKKECERDNERERGNSVSEKVQVL